MTSYFGLLLRLRLSSPISRCLPSCVHRVVVETERSFIWHPAGSIPAPLRRFPRPPSSHHGDRRVGAFLRIGTHQVQFLAVGRMAYRDVRTKATADTGPAPTVSRSPSLIISGRLICVKPTSVDERRKSNGVPASVASGGLGEECNESLGGRRGGAFLRLRSQRSGFESQRGNSPPSCNLVARCFPLHRFSGHRVPS